MVHFGPFAIDDRTWTLTRDAVIVDLSPRLVEILAHLVARDGGIVTKDELLDRFWPDTHVTENTLTRAIADIRKAIDDHAERPAYIQTMARRGYRFIGTTAKPDRRDLPAGDPLREWVDGRLALESLDESRLERAMQAFEHAAAAMPGYAPAFAGLANAHLVRFETTRQRNVPDREALERAIVASRQACALDARLGEAWAVLGHALALANAVEDARAALRRAVSLEPGNWRHHFRLALASWGEERLRGADRALALMPGCAAAHLLSAMVFVARGALDLATGAAEAGVRQQQQQPDTAALPVAGLHWMAGLVHLARDEPARADACLSREIDAAAPARVYRREFVLHARLARGFLRWHEGDVARATEDFEDVLAREPGHARATLGLSWCGLATSDAVVRAIDELECGGRTGEAALLRAAALAERHQADEAIATLEALMSTAPLGPVAWALRADPLFLALHDLDGFARLLATVAARAA